MEKLTLLEIVQDVLSSSDSDNVSAISETVESEQIVKIARTEFNKMAAEYDWDHLYLTTQLTGLGDVTQPNFMQIPDAIAEVNSVRYNVTQSGDSDNEIKEVTIVKDSDDFLDLIYSRNTSDDDISTFNTDEGIPIWTWTNRDPEFCTTFDGKILVFDAYNSDTDTTMQESKSVVRGLKAKSWTESGSFTPDIPGRLFPLFLEKVRLKAFRWLSQKDTSEEKEEVRTMTNRLRRKKRVEVKNKVPNYGRQQ